MDLAVGFEKAVTKAILYLNFNRNDNQLDSIRSDLDNQRSESIAQIVDWTQSHPERKDVTSLAENFIHLAEVSPIEVCILLREVSLAYEHIELSKNHCVAFMIFKSFIHKLDSQQTANMDLAEKFEKAISDAIVSDLANKRGETHPDIKTVQDKLSEQRSESISLIKKWIDAHPERIEEIDEFFQMLPLFAKDINGMADELVIRNLLGGEKKRTHTVTHMYFTLLFDVISM